MIYRTLIATAGHVDHGKTELLKALTGIDCDRWEEEKRRGITIDLGFAFLKEQDVQIGFVDVPGHEKFIKNMLSGVGGVDGFLLCIASDEGIMPQTVEHCQILHHIGLKEGICVLTKGDLVSQEERQALKKEVGDFLGTWFPQEVPITTTSAKTGEGLEALKKLLIQLARRDKPLYHAHPLARLPVDRAFLLKGIGLIITGSLMEGTLSTKEEVYLLPGKIKGRIRTIQVHGEDRQKALARERTSLHIAGWKASQVRRGAVVASLPYPATQRFILDGSFHESLKERERIRVHHLTREVFGRIRRLSSHRVQIFLEQEAFILRGDSIIIRRYSPPLLLGGGRVVDTFLPPWRGKQPWADKVKDLPAEDTPGWIEVWLGKAGKKGLDRAELDYLCGYQSFSLPHHLKIDGRFYHPSTVEKLEQSLREWVSCFQKENPQLSKIPLEEIRHALRVEKPLLAYLIKTSPWDAQEGFLLLRRDESDQGFLKSLQALKNPPYFFSEGELQKILGLPSHALHRQLQTFKRDKRIIALPRGIYLHPDIYFQWLKTLYQAYPEGFTVGDAKKLFSLTRKWMIPLLERWDSDGFTLRVGSERKWRRSQLPDFEGLPKDEG